MSMDNAVIIGIVGLVALLIMFACRVWIGAAMAIVGFVGLVLISGFDRALSVLGSAPFANLNSYTLTVIPMFTLMGMIIAETDIGPSLYRTAYAWIGRMPGGLASATVVASGMLGAITGGHYAATTIMGRIAMPEMRKFKYDDSLATGSIAASAPLAMIIPPSIAMVMYGILTENSVGHLLMSGVIPGVLQILVYIMLIWIMCKRNPALGPAGEKFSLREKLRASKGIIATVVLFLAVLVTVYTGICTTTESGAIGALGALIIAIVTRDMTWKKFYRCLKETLLSTAMIMFLLMGTYVFTTFVSLSKIPFVISDFIASLTVPGGVVILAICIMYIILGMFLPEIPMLVLTVPLLYTSVISLGYSGIWFGLIVVKMMAFGAISPPVGMVVYILSGVSKVPVMKIFKGVLPFLIGDLILVAIFCFFPQIVLFLPNMMMGG